MSVDHLVGLYPTDPQPAIAVTTTTNAYLVPGAPTVTVPLDVLRKLYAVFDAWQNEADCYDCDGIPGTEGMASLIGIKGSWLMDEVTDTFEPHDGEIRALLGLSPGERSYGTKGHDGQAPQAE